MNDFFDYLYTSKYKKSVSVLPTGRCPGTGQEDGWLKVNQPGAACRQPRQHGRLWGSALFPSRDRQGTASVPLLLLWEVEITALSAMHECCEDKCVKPYEVLRQ